MLEYLEGHEALALSPHFCFFFFIIGVTLPQGQSVLLVLTQGYERKERSGLREFYSIHIYLFFFAPAIPPTDLILFYFYFLKERERLRQSKRGNMEVIITCNRNLGPTTSQQSAIQDLAMSLPSPKKFSKDNDTVPRTGPSSVQKKHPEIRRLNSEFSFSPSTQKDEAYSAFRKESSSSFHSPRTPLRRLSSASSLRHFGDYSKPSCSGLTEEMPSGEEREKESKGMTAGNGSFLSKIPTSKGSSARFGSPASLEPCDPALKEHHSACGNACMSSFSSWSRKENPQAADFSPDSLASSASGYNGMDADGTCQLSRKRSASFHISKCREDSSDVLTQHEETEIYLSNFSFGSCSIVSTGAHTASSAPGCSPTAAAPADCAVPDTTPADAVARPRGVSPASPVRVAHSGNPLNINRTGTLEGTSINPHQALAFCHPFTPPQLCAQPQQCDPHANVFFPVPGYVQYACMQSLCPLPHSYMQRLDLCGRRNGPMGLGNGGQISSSPGDAMRAIGSTEDPSSIPYHHFTGGGNELAPTAGSVVMATAPFVCSPSPSPVTNSFRGSSQVLSTSNVITHPCALSTCTGSLSVYSQNVPEGNRSGFHSTRENFLTPPIPHAVTQTWEADSTPCTPNRLPFIAIPNQISEAFPCNGTLNNGSVAPPGSVNLNNGAVCSPSEERSKTNLFVSNIPPEVDDHCLEKLFSTYGEVVRAAVMRNIYTAKSKGSGFVRFREHEQALNAMKELNDKCARCTFREFLNTQDTNNSTKVSEASALETPLSEGHFSGSTQRSGSFDLDSSVLNTHLMLEGIDQQPESRKGFSLYEDEKTRPPSETSATSFPARPYFDPFTCSVYSRGPSLKVAWANGKHDDNEVLTNPTRARKLFIRNVPGSVTKEEVRELFSRYGKVVEVSLHKDTMTVKSPDAVFRSRFPKDALDATATADRTPSCVSLPNTEDSRENANDVFPPSDDTNDSTSPEELRQIAFVTFSDAGVASDAAKEVHNTKPFSSCKNVGLLVKVAHNTSPSLSNRRSQTAQRNHSAPNNLIYSSNGGMPPMKRKNETLNSNMRGNFSSFPQPFNFSLRPCPFPAVYKKDHKESK